MTLASGTVAPVSTALLPVAWTGWVRIVVAGTTATVAGMGAWSALEVVLRASSVLLASAGTGTVTGVGTTLLPACERPLMCTGVTILAIMVIPTPGVMSVVVSVALVVVVSGGRLALSLTRVSLVAVVVTTRAVTVSCLLLMAVLVVICCLFSFRCSGIVRSSSVPSVPNLSSPHLTSVRSVLLHDDCGRI